MSRTGAHNMSRDSSAAIQCAVVSVAKCARSTPCSSVRFAMLRAKLSKRGSAERSGRPIASDISRSGLSLNAPTTTSAPSVVANAPLCGSAPQEKSCRSRISDIAASCICIASIES